MLEEKLTLNMYIVTVIAFSTVYIHRFVLMKPIWAFGGVFSTQRNFSLPLSVLSLSIRL